MFQILAVTTYEVGRYAQVAVIISIPVVIITVACIVWLHYRRRRTLDPIEEKLRETIHHQVKLHAMENEFKQSETDVRYLQDMLQEKQLQIEFLQNQLSQRVRVYHEIESREVQMKEELLQKDQYVQELKDQMNSKDEEVQQLEIKLQQQIGFLAGIQEQLAKGVEQLHRPRDKSATLAAVG